ncbi:MAG: 1-acyl-sn-glycerol-3-phosphate acyltransferase [Spirochaetaceae bacterium]
MGKDNREKKKLKKKQDRKTITPNPVFVRFIRPLIHTILKYRYKLEIDDRVGLSSLKAPYIVVGNHVNFWDPFFIGVYLPHDIQWVATDNVFRTKIFFVLMKLFGSIPASKFMTDMKAVAQIIRVTKKGGVVGVFPEGNKTWDGSTLRHIPTIARLIQKLKLPVIGVITKGGYLSKPRWGRGLRKGKVRMEYRLVFTPEELKSMDSATCGRLLEERIEHNEQEWVGQEKIPFIGKRPAEYIERVLFVCPQCKSIASFYSNGDTAECTSCGYSFRYDPYGELHPVQGPRIFSSVPEWNEWQVRYFYSLVNRDMEVKEPLFEEGPALLWRGYRAEPLKRLNTGRASFYPSGIAFRTTIGKEMFFPLLDIYGENVQDKEKLEFYYQNSLYRLDFLNVRASAYMWYQAISLLHQKAQNRQIDGRAHS